MTKSILPDAGVAKPRENGVEGTDGVPHPAVGRHGRGRRTPANGVVATRWASRVSMLRAEQDKFESANKPAEG